MKITEFQLGVFRVSSSDRVLAYSHTSRRSLRVGLSGLYILDSRRRVTVLPFQLSPDSTKALFDLGIRVFSMIEERNSKRQ